LIVECGGVGHHKAGKVERRLNIDLVGLAVMQRHLCDDKLLFELGTAVRINVLGDSLLVNEEVFEPDDLLLDLLNCNLACGCP